MTISVVTENTTVQNATPDATYTGFDEFNGMLEGSPDSVLNTANNYEVKKYAAGDWGNVICRATGLSSVFTLSETNEGFLLERTDGQNDQAFHGLGTPNRADGQRPELVIDHTGDTVSSATVYFYLATNSGDDATITAYRPIPSWLTGQVTWNVWSTGNTWDTPGALSGGADRDESMSGTGTTGTASGVYYAQDVTDIVNFYVNGTGLAITDFSTDDSFTSGEDADVNGAAQDTVTSATLDGVDVFSDFTAIDASNSTQGTPSLTDTQQSGFPSYGSIDYVQGDGSATVTHSVTHNTPNGKQYIDLAGTLNTDSSQSLIPHEPADPQVGWQLVGDTTAVGDDASTPALTLNADGTFSFTYSSGVEYTFDYQFLDPSTNTLYSAGTATVVDGVIVSATARMGRFGVGLNIGIGV